MADATRHGGEEPFVLSAFVALLVGSIWLVARADRLLDFYYAFELLAVTHVLTLGFATSLIMGVGLRLGPTALGIRPVSIRVARIQLVLFLVGWTGMVFHWLVESWFAVFTATGLVVLAAALQLWNHREAIGKALKGHILCAHVVVGQLALLLAACLGGLLAARKTWGFALPGVDGPFPGPLAAHIHLAGVGWLVITIVGYATKLVPASAGPVPWRWARLGLLAAGTAGLVLTLLTGGPWVPAFALVTAAGCVAPGLAALARPRRGFFWETAGLVGLALVALLGVALSLGWPPPELPLRQRLQAGYVLTGIYGFVVPVALGVAFKLFPLWVWQERFAGEPAPVPRVTELVDRGLVRVAGVFVTSGLGLSLAGLTVGAIGTLRCGLTLILLGVVAFGAAFVRLARWALLAGTSFDPAR